MPARQPPDAKGVNAEQWYCPLLGRVIEAGYCLDINYQRVGLFKPDVLKDVIRLTHLDRDGVSTVCRSCPNQPLSTSDYAEMGVAEDGQTEKKKTAQDTRRDS
jgi:hypothetical protein